MSFLVADVLYSSSFVSYTAGSAVDAGWLCAYVLFGAAALRPGEPTIEADQGLLLHAAWRRVGLVAAIVAAIGVIFYDVAAGESLSWGEAGLAAILIGLVVLRLVLGMQEFERAHETELAARHAVERSRAELADTEARFRALVEQSTDMVVIVRPDMTLATVSGAAESITGIAAEALVDTSLLDLVHPDDVHVFAEANAAGLSTPGYVARFEFRLRTRTGDWRPVETIGKNLTDDPGVRGILATIRDTTERRRAEDALQAGEERFRLIAETSTDIIFVGTGPGMTLQYVSPAMERVLGFTPAEACADPAFWLTHTHPDDLERIVLPEPGGEPVRNTARWLRKDGTWVWIETTASASLDATGTVVIRGAGRDVSEQQAADEALQASEQRFRSIAAQLFDIVMIVDAEGDRPVRERRAHAGARPPAGGVHRQERPREHPPGRRRGPRAGARRRPADAAGRRDDGVPRAARGRLVAAAPGHRPEPSRRSRHQRRPDHEPRHHRAAAAVESRCARARSDSG